jgi:uncharacterized membrane protein YsdA (DUF1294 family)
VKIIQILQDIIIWFSQEPIVWITAIYLVIINFLALMTMWWDKRRARNDGWRVSEATLLLMGFFGGAIGLIIGMFRFRHKTRKSFFQTITLIGLIVSLTFYWIEFRAILWHLYFI